MKTLNKILDIFAKICLVITIVTMFCLIVATFSKCNQTDVSPCLCPKDYYNTGESNGVKECTRILPSVFHPKKVYIKCGNK